MRFISGSVCVLLLATACQPLSTPEAASKVLPDTSGASAKATLTAVFPKTLANKVDPAAVAKVTVQISWPGGGTPLLEMARADNNSFQLVVENLPTSTPCVVTCKALDAQNVVLYQSELSNVVFLPDQDLELVLNLASVEDSASQGQSPRILAVKRPALPVQVRSKADIEFKIGDVDNAELTYLITCSGDGSVSPSGGTATLTDSVATLPAVLTVPGVAGPFQVTIRIEDSKGLAAEFSIGMMAYDMDSSDDTGLSNLTVNFPPQILGVTARRTGDQIALEAKVQDDGPTATLAYTWWRDGNLLGNTNPISTSGGAPLSTISLQVEDALGGATTTIFQLSTTGPNISDLAVENRPPFVVTATKSADDVSYGDVVSLSVFVQDPDQDGMTASWSTTKGSIGLKTATPQGDQTQFTALWNADLTAGLAEITVRITDPLNASVTYKFTVNQVLGRVAIDANAGNDLDALLGSFATLDGSASTSADGVIVTYKWEQVSGPASTIEKPNMVKTRVFPTVAGSCTYRLTVFNVNNSDTATVQLLASDPLGFMFEDADMTDAGLVYFMNKVDRLIHRYDISTQTFLNPLRTRPDLQTMALAHDNSALYVGYTGGGMDVFNPATGERSFFATGPATAIRMVLAGKYLYTLDSTGAWGTRALYRRTDGVRTSSMDWTNPSNGLAFCARLSRVFGFRDGTSPNDIMRVDVNQDTGVLSNAGESPYHGDYSFIHPMRLFPDETRIAVASGVIFNTSDLTYAGSLGKGYVDLTFHKEQPYLINKSGTTKTELTVMAKNFALIKTQVFDNEPLRLFIAGDTLTLVTKRGTRLISVTNINLVE